MRVRRCLALVAVLCLAIVTTPALPAQKSSASWRVTTKGFGPVRVGMTVDEASAALGVPFDVDEPLDEADGCRYAKPRTGFEGLAFMLSQGRVVRVDVYNKSFATLSGARVGDTELRIKTMYPGRIEVSPHEYIDGHYLTYVPKDASDKNFRIVFETDGKRVTMIRAGRLPEVGYVEGCA